MNAEGRMLLRAVILHVAALGDAVKQGDCASIAATVNGWMPKDMQITPVDVHYALVGLPGYTPPKHNAQVLRARIDKAPQLHSARIQAGVRGPLGDHGVQTIANELNMAHDHKEHVTPEDVRAAMDLAVVPVPTNTVQGAAALVGTAKLG